MMFSLTPDPQLYYHTSLAWTNNNVLQPALEAHLPWYDLAHKINLQLCVATALKGPHSVHK